jgi:nitrate reductase gamma subunit
MSDLLYFTEHGLQEIALVFMGTVYIIRIIWFLSFKAGGERQAPTGSADTTPGKGAAYSLANVAMPWAMESTRKNMFFYIQFVVFHVAAVISIMMTFVIPYLPGILKITAVVRILQVLFGLGFVIGVGRFIRRIVSPYMRAISTPDDYFSLALLTVWLFFAVLAVPNDTSKGEGIMLTYFFLTTFFLIYVPFSKISHYLYYPFTRYYLGKTMGRRGVYPVRRGPQLDGK